MRSSCFGIALSNMDRSGHFLFRFLCLILENVDRCQCYECASEHFTCFNSIS